MPAMMNSLELPCYETFSDTIAPLELPLSSSELHGVMCGYLSAGASTAGGVYLRALMVNRHDDITRAATLALFNLYTVTEQQIMHEGFVFELFLPDDDEDLALRAKAFSQWCEGYTQGITMAGVDYHQFHDEDTQEALQHITEFAELDYQSIEVGSDDERSLMEVYEYTRVSVLHIFNDLNLNRLEHNHDGEVAH